MSFILDALRKSQQARQPGAPSRTGAVHNTSLSLPASGWWLALGLVLLFGLLAAGFLFWRTTVGSLPDPPAEPAPVETVTPAEPAPTPSATAEKQPLAASPPARETIPVSDLAEQAKVPVPVPPPKKIMAERPAKKTPAPKPAASSQTSVALAAVPLDTDDTPLLQQMPQDFQRALPSLAVTIHVYSHDASQRILFINNREYRQGSRIEDGIRVEDIVPDGVILSFRGERFKLGRPR